VGKPTAAIALKVREGNGLLRGKKIDGSWHAFYGKDRLSDAQVADLAAWLQSAE
jgi:mono/diheme cytochrome c family protein